MRRAVRPAAIALGALACWFVVSSYLFVAIAGLTGKLDQPWLAWWTYCNAQPDWWTKVLLTASAATLPAAVALYLVVSVRYKLRRLRRPFFGGVRPVEPGATNNHGNADWAEMKDARRLFPGPSPRHGGIVVGEAYRPDRDTTAGSYFNPRNRRTWGQGGKAPLLIDPCTDRPGHCILIAPAGGFKTSSLVTTINEWIASSVVLDAAGELGPMMRSILERDHEKAVHFLNPVRPENAPTWGFDALDWIDPDSQTFEEDVHTVISWVFGSDKDGKDDQFFIPYAKSLVACLLADLLSDDNPIAPKTLATLRVGITRPQPDLRAMLRGIYDNSNCFFAREIAGTIMGMVDKQFDGIYGTAVKSTAWVGFPTLGSLVSGDAFKTDDIINGRTTVFVQIPMDTLDHSPGVARVIIGSLMKAVMRAEGENDKVLFALDEVFRLKHMAVIENARDMLRKSGVVLFMIYQSVGQEEEQWGPSGKKKWNACVSWRGYAGVRDLQTAEELSKECGHHGALARSEGENAGTQGSGPALFANSRSRGRNQNTHEIKRPVAYLHELLQEMREDAVVIVGTGRRPILCGLPIYFRRPNLVEKVNVSRFVKEAA